SKPTRTTEPSGWSRPAPVSDPSAVIGSGGGTKGSPVRALLVVFTHHATIGDFENPTKGSVIASPPSSTTPCSTYQPGCAGITYSRDGNCGSIFSIASSHSLPKSSVVGLPAK